MKQKTTISFLFLFFFILGSNAQNTSEFSITSSENILKAENNKFKESYDFETEDNNVLSLPQLSNQTSILHLQNDIKVHGTVMFDVLGFVAFGPTLNVELALGRHVSILAGTRFISIGLLPNILYDEDEFKGVIVGAFKFFVHPNNGIDGFFISPHFEYGKYYRMVDYYNGSDPVREPNQLMVPGLEIGYRWIWDKRFSLEISDNFAAVMFKNHRMDEVTNWKMEMFVPYLLSVKLGVAF